MSCPATVALNSWRLITALALFSVAFHGCDANTSGGVLDMHGNAVDPSADSAALASVLLFIEAGCPVSNRYAPEIQSLYERYAPRGIDFWLVYPDPDTSAQAVREHMQDYGYSMPALRDPEHTLVGRARAQVTPEAAIFLGDGALVYHGRIDNRYVDLATRRPEATVHDVAAVLDEVLEDKLPGSSRTPKSQPAFGCYIRDFK